ncbi:ASTRA-associated protein 1 [Echria macrotheca]|uniref:ASTRA-associated protein 1 n=1 Tax=Echria macrotheca TaxID=438768 RepID=A0AAJ0FEX3_9PEZI|nr:ASTRA-associated protein 1 [Echria macrotheca]
MATDERPPQPKSILRGHKASVHAATFIRGNERLLTGDADGFVVAWDLTILRPRAVWQAHGSAILGLAGWGSDKVITHGRDNRLVVWKLSTDDESRLSTSLPLDPSPEARPQPWMIHLLEINTMNFCSFSYCPVSAAPETVSEEIFVAVPNTLASEAIDIFHLPSQERRHTIKPGDKNGMAMALSVFYLSGSLTLIAGYENGIAIVSQLRDTTWTTTYRAQTHTQPILSLDISPTKDYFLTSSADALIVKHPLLFPSNTIPTQETIADHHRQASKTANAEKSLLSAALQVEAQAAAPPPSTTDATPSHSQTQTAAANAGPMDSGLPTKVINTKHAGQQSLRIRSDGLVFATAGWDGKIRVYSARTMKEVAVLKWHREGCYAVAFASVEDASPPTTTIGETSKTKGEGEGEGGEEGGEILVVPKLVDMSLRQKRIRHARTAHWLAAGSKDGRVSLWDVF